jgi:ketosteroid isomerase-like protein
LNPIPAYLRHLDDGEVEEAAALFSQDAVYLRPNLATRQPGQPGGLCALALVRGREAILDYFRRRGKQAHRHVVMAEGRAGDHCFVEMTLSGFGAPIEAIGIAELDTDGLISRYVALATPLEPEVADCYLPSGVAS